MTSRMFRPTIAALLLALTAACAPKDDLNKPPPPLGRFLLGVHAVIDDNMEKSPISRTATEQEWKDALNKAMVDRFGRYDGDTYYDFAITVEGYALAPPGIPILLSPKSVLVIQVLVFYDAKQEMLNPVPKRFIVFEGTSPQTIIGSGLTRTKAEQMKVLSYNAVKDIEGWLLKHPEWFPATGEPVPEPKPQSGKTSGKTADKGADAAAKPGAAASVKAVAPAATPALTK